MAEGDWIEVGIASANRDESVYPEAESFRLDRSDPKGHVAFGAGPHVCPGAILARTEALTAVDVLLDTLRELRSVPGEGYPPIPGNLGHKAVPAVLVPKGAG